MPFPNQAAAVLGVGLGLLCFFGAAMVLGGHHASLAWLLAWAMIWSPSFCTIDGERIKRSEARQVARDLGVLGATATAIFAILYPSYCAGRLLLS